MNSYDNLNNFKYLGKIVVIALIVFLILKYAINLRQVEAVLLSAIIAVSILIIENIFFINNEASDPLNCDQCKVQQVKENPNLNNEITPSITQLKEDFNTIDDLQKDIKNITDTILNNNKEGFQNVEHKKLIDGRDDRDVREDKNDKNLTDIELKPVDNSSNLTLDSYIDDQAEKNLALLQDKYISETNEPTSLPAGYPQSDTFEPKPSGKVLSDFSKKDLSENDFTKLLEAVKNEYKSLLTNLPAGYPQSDTFELKPSEKVLSDFSKMDLSENDLIKLIEAVKNEYKSLLPNQNKDFINEEAVKNEYKSLLTNQNKDFIDNKIPSMNLNDLTIPGTIPEGDPAKGTSISFDESYVQYQKNGLEKLDQLDTLKTNIFRASIGDQQVVQEYLQDGVKYNDRIYSYSTDAPKTYEALNSELKYGDYNYIGPLNKGMINKAYTFINPTNWYPIPPFPPVCVTNKSCTTCPIQITDGKDYMNFASLEDFDAARRFTGDMRINVDYIKNVLNNPNGY